jgi:hypothetical protein
VNQIGKNDVHLGLEVVSSDKDIHLSLGVVKEKMGNFPLNMCSIVQNNSYDNI